MEYDVIGDIHGDASKLSRLLDRLGYHERNGARRSSPDRMAVFLGDLIDRGPEQVETVDIVRRMVDAGTAVCVMGNHELNAIGYATQNSGGEFLRPHSRKNIDQHAAFLEQVGEGSKLHNDLIDWFKTLPAALDLGVIRAVHAWWNEDYVRTAGNRPLSEEELVGALTRGTDEYVALDGLTKGLELQLPVGCSFQDASGHTRANVRVQWWLEGLTTYREAAIVPQGQEDAVPDLPLPCPIEAAPRDGAPIFVGHYWLTGTPGPQTPLVACLDYSSAKGGPLVAYRWRGEAELRAEAMECVR